MMAGVLVGLYQILFHFYTGWAGYLLCGIGLVQIMVFLTIQTKVGHVFF